MYRTHIQSASVSVAAVVVLAAYLSASVQNALSRQEV